MIYYICGVGGGGGRFEIWGIIFDTFERIFLTILKHTSQIREREEVKPAFVHS